jgi:hypothetical protein
MALLDIMVVLVMQDLRVMQAVLLVQQLVVQFLKIPQQSAVLTH